MKSFYDLTEKEILAVAIDAEEEDSRIYRAFAEMLKEDYPASAKVLADMVKEENEHRRLLLNIYHQKFGQYLPPIRRVDVKGFLKRRSLWLAKKLSPEKIRKEVEYMEYQAYCFYNKAVGLVKDVKVRKLLGDLAEIEKNHEYLAQKSIDLHINENVKKQEENTRKRIFVLQYVQPGLAGLMDGSVSTLAPLFAAAFATHNNHKTFLIGLAASIGAGISMGFTEALSDDGVITGRGGPWVRGLICGVMTTLGGIGHTIPYIIPNNVNNAFMWATGIAIFVVIVELWLISWIRSKYMDTPFLKAVFQIVVGGVLVLLTGILIGDS